MKDIVREGHPSLREKAEMVLLPPSSSDLELLKQMIEFIKNSQDSEKAKLFDLRPGVGLAAPQLGIGKRLIAVHCTDSEDKLFSYALFNPKIISHSAKLCYLTTGEGCLSVDREVPGIVPRYAKVTVVGTTHEGEEIKIRLKGLPSIVFQHEIDHLNGIMFYDHINSDSPFTPPVDSLPIDR
jgi:peptide deformylase